MVNGLIGNRGGIPFVDATQTDAGSATTNAVYTLPDHTFRFIGGVGLMCVNVQTAAASTVTGVDVSVNGSVLTMTDGAGAALTTVTVGEHIVAFNKYKNTLKLLV